MIAFESSTHEPSRRLREPATDAAPFFVIGAPRSGTTLLRTMLAAHPRICIPHETEFFMQVRGETDPIRLRSSFLKYARTHAFAQQGLDANAVLEAASHGASGTPSRASLFLAMMRIHAVRAGKARVGEKSPHHCRHVERIGAELPQAKFIHIYRDPRDVVASRLQLDWSSRSAAANAKSWSEIMREHRRLLSVMPPERYCEVRFETLLESPERELRRLCDFLGEEFSPEMLRFDRQAQAGKTRGESGWAGSVTKPVEGAAIGRHKERLSERQVWLVQRITRREMQALGYPLEPVRARLWWPLVNIAERVRHRLAAWRKRIVKRLPSLLFQRVDPHADRAARGLGRGSLTPPPAWPQ